MNYQGPGRYRHYKGGEYEVLGLVVDEVDAATLRVIYRPIDKMPDDVVQADFWSRPLGEFNDEIDFTDNSVPRFQKVSA